MINKVNFRGGDLEALSIRIVGSAELDYYWTIQIDDMGCVEIAAKQYGKEPLGQISIDPREAIKVAEQMIICAQEELKKQAF